MKKFLISGITGQDGQIASKLLYSKGYLVAGITHKSNKSSIDICGCSSIWYWDWENELEISNIIKNFKPDFFLNFAAYHHSSSGNTKDIKNHQKMIKVNIVGLSKLIHVLLEFSPNTKIIHASSSQIYSTENKGEVIDETTLSNPQTFYGYTKNAGMEMIDFYRKNFNLLGLNVILFNHESEFRTSDFVTRKITMEVAKIKLGLSDKLHLKNIGAMADFSSAYDVVEAIIKLCESSKLGKIIISSGKALSIEELVKYAFEAVDLNWVEYTSFGKNEAFPYLIGNNENIIKTVDYKFNFDMRLVIKSMVEYDLSLLKEGKKF